MKRTIVITVMVAVLLSGCSSNDDDGSGVGGMIATSGVGGVTAMSGAGGATTTSGTDGVTAMSGAGVTTTSGASGVTATSGASGVTATGGADGTAGGSATDPCPGGVSTESLLLDTVEKLAELANCTTLNNIVITGSNITNLEALSQVTTITGSLTIQDSQVLDLQGLNNLTSIGGDFYIGPQLSMDPVITPLTSLNGLNNLATIGGNMIINDNTMLTDISALGNLTSIGSDGFLQMRNNLALPTCSAEALATQLNLDSATGDVEICGTNDVDDCTWGACLPRT